MNVRGWCAQVQPLHRQHTAQVLTLCTPDTTRVLSGGADKRVVLHTLGAPGGAGATVGRLLLDGRVNRIICRGEALLVSTCTAREQVCLFDARSVGMGGGGKEMAALRFVRPLASEAASSPRLLANKILVASTGSATGSMLSLCDACNHLRASSSTRC